MLLSEDAPLSVCQKSICVHNRQAAATCAGAFRQVALTFAGVQWKKREGGGQVARRVAHNGLVALTTCLHVRLRPEVVLDWQGLAHPPHRFGLARERLVLTLWEK